jgi:uncharacterized membrane protein
METVTQNTLTTVVVVLLYVIAALAVAQILRRSKYKLPVRLQGIVNLFEVPMLKPMIKKLYLLSKKKQQRVKEKRLQISRLMRRELFGRYQTETG